MIHNSVEAFVEGDEANARKVVEHDDMVDDLFNEVKTEMMQAIREQNLDADRVVDYLMMAKYLEKVGDHAALPEVKLIVPDTRTFSTIPAPETLPA